MANLICLNTVFQWEHEQVSRYPEIRAYIEKLKSIILEKPESGLPDQLLLEAGKTILCRKHSVNIRLFSHHYAIGYGYISAHYVFNADALTIVRIGYT